MFIVNATLELKLSINITVASLFISPPWWEACESSVPHVNSSLGRDVAIHHSTPVAVRFPWQAHDLRDVDAFEEIPHRPPEQGLLRTARKSRTCCASVRFTSAGA